MLTPISAVDARTGLAAHQAGGNHVDERLLRELDAPGDRYLMTLRTEAEFFSLVWQSISYCRPLVLPGEPRTLRDCAFRLQRYGWSFQDLVNAGYPWFTRCDTIDKAFDFIRFHWIVLTPLTLDESRETPTGTHYVYDGVHKTLVLAKKLIRDGLQYRPLTALLLTPRRT